MFDKKTVILLESNLFFLAKVSAIVQNNGLAAKRASNIAQIQSINSAETVVLLIVNLLSPGIKCLELISDIKKYESLRHVPMIGFAGHLEADLMQQAQNLGCQTVLSNGALIANLPQILKQF